MPKLYIKNIYCIETEDNLGADNAYITIDDTQVWGREKINNGETKDVGITHEFVGSAMVRLYDYDSDSADDLLGEMRVTAFDGDGKEKDYSFTGDDANYRLNYRIY